MVLACAVAVSSPAAWAQQKKTITEGQPPTSRYVQEHVIDVGDAPGRQVRIFEIRNTYSENGLMIDGVKVRESTSYGTSDYTTGTGLFTSYGIYMMEDGSRIYTRGGGASQQGDDGTRAFSYTERITGGTGRFQGIRGMIRGEGKRAAGASTLTRSFNGEYWMEQ
jgi:hypothetical protein